MSVLHPDAPSREIAQGLARALAHRIQVATGHGTEVQESIHACFEVVVRLRYRHEIRDGQAATGQEALEKSRAEKFTIPKLIYRAPTECENGHYHSFNDPIMGIYTLYGDHGKMTFKLQTVDPWEVQFCRLCGATLK